MVLAGTVLQIRDKLLARSVPAVTRWNRLEARPRAHDFDRALKAEVRDALWMLAKQWQMGEFIGDDAGSPVLARICLGSTAFDRFHPGTAADKPFSLERPLETTVERRPVNWETPNAKLSLDLRLALGRRWHKMLDKVRAKGELSKDYWPKYLEQYKVAVPNPNTLADAHICAHPEVWQQFGAAADRAMDGYALLDHIAKGGAAAEGINSINAADTARLAALATALDQWMRTLIDQPDDPARDAWQPSRFEYRFGCTAPYGTADFRAVADEYSSGHLDWYSVDRDAAGAHAGNAAPAMQGNTFIPTSLTFSGMPNTRWWEFEEQRTNFGQVTPDTPEIGKLLLLEFGLVYANDWFVFPYTLPIGSVARVEGISLTNVFGERIWIEPVPRVGKPGWEAWSMFQLTGDEQTSDLVMLPSTPFVLEGAPLEEIAMVRDEMANLVFGIERRVPMSSGASKPGGEAGRELFAAVQRIEGSPPAPPPPVALIRYELMNTVPEHWIPFLPVQVHGSSRETQLQRGAMPRLLGPDPAKFKLVEPRSSLLRPGLDETPKQPFFVFEEEVPRAGVQVKLAYQRTRWLDGRTFVWLGAGKTTGRGEAASGLAFDRLVPTDFKPPV
jgi:hypothetical protein